MGFSQCLTIRCCLKAKGDATLQDCPVSPGKDSGNRGWAPPQHPVTVAERMLGVNLGLLLPIKRRRQTTGSKYPPKSAASPPPHIPRRERESCAWGAIGWFPSLPIQVRRASRAPLRELHLRPQGLLGHTHWLHSQALKGLMVGDWGKKAASLQMTLSVSTVKRNSSSIQLEWKLSITWIALGTKGNRRVFYYV